MILLGGLGIAALNLIPVGGDSHRLLGVLWLAWTVIGVAVWARQHRRLKRTTSQPE